MSRKSKLSDLSTQLQKPSKKHNQPKANAPRGERSNFLKVTITIPPDMWVKLKNIGTQRKAKALSARLMKKAITMCQVWFEQP